MAPIPRVKSLKREDYPQAPAWFDQLLLVLNQQAGDVSHALSNGLTQSENGRAEFKVVDVTMPLEYPQWRVVGATGQPPFQNNFTAWGAPETPPRFRMLPNGRVQVGGLLRVPTPTVIFVAIWAMPAGYIPRTPMRFSQMNGNPAAQSISVLNNGNVVIEQGGAVAATFIQLDGIEYDAGGPAARVESFGAPFPLSVRLTNKWPVKTCQVVSVFDVTGQQPGTVGPVEATWQTREAGMLTIEALWGLQPGRSYRLTLLVTAG